MVWLLVATSALTYARLKCFVLRRVNGQPRLAEGVSQASVTLLAVAQEHK